MNAWYDDLPGPATRTLINSVLANWADHAPFLQQSFGERNDRELRVTEHLAELVLRLEPDRGSHLATGYQWMCKMVLEEQLHFKRTGTYRYSSFAEVDALVYQQSTKMSDYMSGLLLSSVMWANHIRSITYFIDEFLPRNRTDFHHLEVGPGHGLLLYLAAMDPRCASVTGVDISGESLRRTERALSLLNLEKPSRCVGCDIMAPIDLGRRFDSVVISEVCEHLQDPRTALTNLRAVMAEGGRIFVNVPVNSPAIDHICLLKSPEEVVELVASAGFEVVGSMNAPTSGYSEARARKHKMSISVCVIGKVP